MSELDPVTLRLLFALVTTLIFFLGIVVGAWLYRMAYRDGDGKFR